MKLEQRVAVLERRCRALLMLVAVLAVVGVAAGFKQGDGVPETLRAQNLEIVDASGKVHIVLGRNISTFDVVNKYGLTIRNEKGAVRTALYGSDDGSGLTLYSVGDRQEPVKVHAGRDYAVVGVGASDAGIAVLASKDGPLIQMRGKNNEVVFSKP